MRDVARRVAGAGSRALRRTIADRWALLQGTAAATAAWLLARYVFDHPEPVFAPLAALIALNTSLGERGLNALRLLQGVVLGIVVGELTLAALAGGYGSMALAILVATGLARALGGSRVAIAQAAAGAIITVAGTDAEAGVERLSDALIGAGVALVFSQVLFSPEPIALLRRAEAAVLERLAAGLNLTARAVEQGDDELAEQAIAALRELPEDVTELRRMSRASARVARRTLAWRSRRELVVHESENAGHLDLLAGSCVLLARLASRVTSSERRTVEQCVRGLAGVLATLVDGLDDREIRQDGAERALEIATSVADFEASADPALADALNGVRIVATDVMVFAGVEQADALQAIRDGILERRATDPPPGRPRRLRRLWRRVTGRGTESGS